jgi:hypothetical protein
MMLAKRPHTVGNRRRYRIDYSEWLDEGVTVASATVVSSSSTAPIDGVLVAGNFVTFFVNGGALNETFTASVAMVDSKSGIKNDTMDFFVVAP